MQKNAWYKALNKHLLNEWPKECIIEEWKIHIKHGISGNTSCPILPSQCDMTYNMRNRPEILYENGYNVTLDYDDSGMRRHMQMTKLEKRWMGFNKS